MKLGSLRIPKAKLSKKSKKSFYDEELSVLKARNTILRSVAEVLAMKAGNWKGVDGMVRHHSSFIKINELAQNNLLNGDQHDESDQAIPVESEHSRVDLSTLLELINPSSSSEQRLSGSQSSLQSYINCVRRKPIDFLIHHLRKNQSNNQQRISELLSDVEKRRKQLLNEESFFCRHPSLMTPENRKMTLFINNIKEKNLVYNLKSSFSVENKYLQMMEDYIKFNSKKQMLEYNGTGRLISHGQRKASCLV